MATTERPTLPCRTCWPTFHCKYLTATGHTPLMVSKDSFYLSVCGVPFCFSSFSTGRISLVCSEQWFTPAVSTRRVTDGVFVSKYDSINVEGGISVFIDEGRRYSSARAGRTSIRRAGGFYQSFGNLNMRQEWTCQNVTLVLFVDFYAEWSESSYVSINIRAPAIHLFYFFFLL